MEINNETLGQSTEKIICDLSGLDSSHLIERSNKSYEEILTPLITKALKELPKVESHTGLKKGSRGGQSKSKIDFILSENRTLSVKTNKSYNTMVCAPEVGQASWKVLEKYYGSILKENNISFLNEENYKKLVFNSIAKFTEIQISWLFSCDYLLWIFLKKNKFNYKIINVKDLKKIEWKNENFSSLKKDGTPKSLDEWKESTKFRYKGIPIIEAQIHSHRSPPNKFRFDMKNLCKLLGL
jgi:hypothetical protein